MSNQTGPEQTNITTTRRTRADRQWWGFGTDAGGCIGCGPAWWVIAGVIALIILFWGWGWPGYGGWGGYGWRHAGTAPPTSTVHTTGASQPAGNNAPNH